MTPTEKYLAATEDYVKKDRIFLSLETSDIIARLVQCVRVMKTSLKYYSNGGDDCGDIAGETLAECDQILGEKE